MNKFRKVNEKDHIAMSSETAPDENHSQDLGRASMAIAPTATGFIVRKSCPIGVNSSTLPA